MRARIVLVLLAVLAFAAAPALADVAADVNVFNGTEPGAADFGTGGGAGNTFPGATRPFGMVQLSPDTLPGTTNFGGGYTYSDPRIGGLSLRHLSGPGCAAYQDFPLMPTVAPIASSPVQPASTNLDPEFTATFDHAHEQGAPGAYGVTLNPGGPDAIQAQLAAGLRTGIMRFTFPKSARAAVLANVAGSANGSQHAEVTLDPATREISGTVTSGQFCYQRNAYTLHFVARFDRPFATHGTWRRDALQPGVDRAEDTIADANPLVFQPPLVGPGRAKGDGTTAQAGGYATFDTTTDPTVQARVALSSVSVAAARANLDAAGAGRSLETVTADARAAWNRMLGRIRVRGGSVAHRRVFATQLYHALLHPSLWSDADGRYTGFDGKVHASKAHPFYVDYSGWDTYRTQMPLVAMLAPGRASDMVRSMLAAYDQSGALPKWSQGNGHTHVMSGDPADPLMAGAWAFGARDFSVRHALAAAVDKATRYAKARTGQPYFERSGLPEYLAKGYVPSENDTSSVAYTFAPEKTWGTASSTLEYAVADFAISRLAGAAGDRSAAARFLRRSANWRKVFNRAAGYVQPRRADGSFVDVPPEGEDGFVEGNSAQYSLFVPQDPLGLFSALGGRAKATARLDDFFSEVNAGPASPHAFLGNEPTLSTPWLYLWARRPSGAAGAVRRALLALYADTPTGMPGNDDLGSMGSWWVFSAIGLYPIVPGTDLLGVGSPLFPHVELRLPGGTVRIDAPRAAPLRPYVSSLRVGGRVRTRAWLRFSSLSRGARLRFGVSATPGKRFGTGAADVPPSFAP